MAPGRPTINSELMLYAEHIDIIEIQEICSASVGVEILFQKLETHTLGIIIPFLPIIDCPHETIAIRHLCRNRLAKIVGEGRDSAKPWQVIAQEGDTLR